MELNIDRVKWFVNGLVIGVLTFATLNALSYFIRSGGWANLIDPRATPQAIGFPFEIWRLGATYKGAMIDQRAMTLNVVTALIVGTVLGLIGVARSGWLIAFTESMIEDEKNKLADNQMQFTLRGLLIMTSIAAVVAALARASVGARPELLIAIYLFGPLFLILLAMVPRGLSWQFRVILLTPSTLMMIVFAIHVGNRLEMNFDHVMLGIFICWVPQTVIAAVGLTIGMAIRYNNRQNSTQMPAE